MLAAGKFKDAYRFVCDPPFDLRFNEKEKASVVYRIPLTIYSEGKELEKLLVYDTHKQVLISPPQEINETNSIPC